MKKPLLLLTACLILATGSLASAQKKQDKSIDANKLRSALSATLGAHAEVVRHELVRRSNWHGGQLFWVASIKPKQVGHYSIKYRYKYNQPLYSHVEHDLLFRVGKKGCLRNVMDNGYYAKFCLGDTVILPVFIENFTEHEFTLKFTTEEIDDVRQSGSWSEIQPENPLSDHLVYIGNRSHVSLKRAGGYTVTYSATFEALKPGRFNLSLSSLPLASVSGNERGGIAVIVVDRDTPITAIAAREQVEGFSIGYDGREYVSSSGGTTSFITDVLIIQTGDRFTFQYGSESYSAKQEREHPVSKTESKNLKPPFIRKLPFWFDGTSSYNEWIKDTLP